MNGQEIGLIGGVLGMLGGIIGTCVGVYNTHGPKERAFVLWCAFWMWLAIIVFLSGLLLLPTPFNVLLWVPYSILLPYSTRLMNRRIEEIRQTEAAAVE